MITNAFLRYYILFYDEKLQYCCVYINFQYYKDENELTMMSCFEREMVVKKSGGKRLHASVVTSHSCWSTLVAIVCT